MVEVKPIELELSKKTKELVELMLKTAEDAKKILYEKMGIPKDQLGEQKGRECPYLR